MKFPEIGSSDFYRVLWAMLRGVARGEITKNNLSTCVEFIKVAAALEPYMPEADSIPKATFAFSDKEEVDNYAKVVAAQLDKREAELREREAKLQSLRTWLDQMPDVH